MRPRMTEQRPQILERHEMSPAEVSALEDKFNDFNASRTGFHDAASIGFQLELHGKIVGGVAGFTWAGFCELRQLWIDEPFRRSGLGTELLNRVVAEARARNCSHIYLATYSFQAPEFYKKFGFEAVAVIDGRPPGHQDIIMRLSLAS